MKFLIAITFFSFLFLNSITAAHGVEAVDNHTQREEAEGKEIWNKLQNKEMTCAGISDDDFGALGEYFMGQMVGEAHEAMNNMMTQMMGKEGEEEMHVVMGKRLSGCDASAVIPSQGIGFMSMMQMMPMMGGRGMSPVNYNFGSWNTWGWLNGITTLLFWAVLILALVALTKWIFKDKSR